MYVFSDHSFQLITATALGEDAKALSRLLTRVRPLSRPITRVPPRLRPSYPLAAGANQSPWWACTDWLIALSFAVVADDAGSADDQ